MSSLTPLLQGPLTVWHVSVPARDVVYVKGIFEASEGLGAVLAPPREPRAPRASGGQLVIAAPHSRAREAGRVLADLQDEFGEAMVVEVVP